MPRTSRKKRVITYVEQLPGGRRTGYRIVIEGELTGQPAAVKTELAERCKDTPVAQLPGAGVLRISTLRPKNGRPLTEPEATS